MRCSKESFNKLKDKPHDCPLTLLQLPAPPEHATPFSFPRNRQIVVGQCMSHSHTHKLHPILPCHATHARPSRDPVPRKRRKRFPCACLLLTSPYVRQLELLPTRYKTGTSTTDSVHNSQPHLLRKLRQLTKSVLGSSH